MNEINCPATGLIKIHHHENDGLVKQRIRSLSDDELESLAAHADFYQRRLNLRRTAGLVLVHDALLSLGRREQSPRPEDLASPMAFKFYLKRVIRSLIDSDHQPVRKPEPSQLDAGRASSRRERKALRCRQLDACRQLGETFAGIFASSENDLSDEFLKPLPGGLTPRPSRQPAGSLLLPGTGRPPLPAIA